MGYGEIIRNERKKKHLTQKELAEMVGTTQAALSAYENNTMVPSLGTLGLICDALDIFIADILDPDWKRKYAKFSTIQEIEVYEMLAELTEEGQNKVRDYTADIFENPKYRK